MVKLTANMITVKADLSLTANFYYVPLPGARREFYFAGESGFIYGFRPEQPESCFRIGRARDVEGRLKTHRRDYGTCKLQFSVPVSDMQSIERLVKTILREERVGVTEWYDVSERTARRAVDRAIKVDHALSAIWRRRWRRLHRQQTQRAGRG